MNPQPKKHSHPHSHSHSPTPDCCSIRDIRQIHLDELIKVSGVVTRRTGVVPMMQEVFYDCGQCGYRLGPFLQTKEAREPKPNMCVQCQAKGPFLRNAQQTRYRNYQKITLQVRTFYSI